MSDAAAGTAREYARRVFWRGRSPRAYECPDCGRGFDRVYQFDVHHEDGDPHNNDPDNLVGVCHRCHVWRHRTGPTLSGLDVDEWKAVFADIVGAPPSDNGFMTTDGGHDG